MRLGDRLNTIKPFRMKLTVSSYMDFGYCSTGYFGMMTQSFYP